LQQLKPIINLFFLFLLLPLGDKGTSPSNAKATAFTIVNKQKRPSGAVRLVIKELHQAMLKQLHITASQQQPHISLAAS
jgi:hypothetical protein